MNKPRVFLLVILTLSLLLFLKPPLSYAEETGEEETIHTLEDQTLLSGKTEPGTDIICTVYTYQNGRDRIILYQSKQKTEESGLYCLVVPLPLIGTQFIRLELGEEVISARAVRYPRSLVEEITGYQLNLYEFLIENGRITPGGTP
ncbi:MAG: hypothetical protein J5589_04935 [Firmicutes bacterium]|nr:hypothetical protein [Bacillota bacterium]